MWFLICAVAVCVLWWSLGQREIFRVVVRDGRVIGVRGRIPQGVLSEFAEIVARPPVRRATVRAVRGIGGAQLSVEGDVDEGRAQRMRNILALYPASRLRATEGERRTAESAIVIAIEAFLRGMLRPLRFWR